MTVKELIELLEGFDPSALVIMAKDSEGNEYSPLAGAYDNTTYIPDSTYSGSAKIRELTPELILEGYTEDDTYNDDDGVSAIVVYPIN
jgi:hypothetical protein